MAGSAISCSFGYAGHHPGFCQYLACEIFLAPLGFAELRRKGPSSFKAFVRSGNETPILIGQIFIFLKV
jgi:hypothetical protein